MAHIGLAGAQPFGLHPFLQAADGGLFSKLIQGQFDFSINDLPGPDNHLTRLVTVGGKDWVGAFRAGLHVPFGVHCAIGPQQRSQELAHRLFFRRKALEQIRPRLGQADDAGARGVPGASLGVLQFQAFILAGQGHQSHRKSQFGRGVPSGPDRPRHRFEQPRRERGLDHPVRFALRPHFGQIRTHGNQFVPFLKARRQPFEFG